VRTISATSSRFSATTTTSTQRFRIALANKRGSGTNLPVRRDAGSMSPAHTVWADHPLWIAPNSSLVSKTSHSSLNAAGRAVKHDHFLVAGPMLAADEVALSKEQDPLTDDLYKAGCAPPTPRPTPKRHRRVLARWKKRSQSHQASTEPVG